MHSLLSIQNLSVDFGHSSAAAVSIEQLTLYQGRTLALVGESGSGKSVTALSILNLLPPATNVNGSILFSPPNAEAVDLRRLGFRAMRRIRGKKIAMIFQEPMTSLNPVFTCGNQVIEAIRTHTDLTVAQAREKTILLFNQVGLADTSGILNRYPHQLSGGQKQRVMIAMAISCDPVLLIADEPTTALDVRVQKSILQLLRKIQSERNLSILLITHDLGIVADVADDVAVMLKGKIVEQGAAREILSAPKHYYTKALLACRPGANAKGKKLAVLADFTDGVKTDKVAETNVAEQTKLINEKQVLMKIEHLTVKYERERSFLKPRPSPMVAVDDVSFEIDKNEILGLVGESGCGKSSLARAIMQLQKPSAGRILLKGKDISHLAAPELRRERKDLQIVFQDPYGSLNPRLAIGDAIIEAMKVHGMEENDRQRKEKISELLKQVQLEADHFNRYPHQFSGGQRQRICIARALSLQPSFLLFDESVSALDVSVQAQVLNLINELRSAYNFTSLFISHDLAVVHYICDRIMVMQAGRIVESGDASQVFHSPNNEYTRQLIEAIPGRNLTSGA